MHSQARATAFFAWGKCVYFPSVSLSVLSLSCIHVAVHEVKKVKNKVKKTKFLRSILKYIMCDIGNAFIKGKASEA